METDICYSLHFSGDVMNCVLWFQFPRVDTQVHHVTTPPVVAYFECIRIQTLQRFRPRERKGRHNTKNTVNLMYVDFIIIKEDVKLELF